MGMLNNIKGNRFTTTNRQAGLLEQVVGVVNRLSPLALLLSVLWLCWALAQLLWLALAPPTAPRLPPVPLQPTAMQTVPQDAYMVFANPAPQTPVNQPPPDIKVQGVMVATPTHNSSAILSINGSSHSYGIDDPLAASGYTLSAVAWDKVTIADASGQTIDIMFREPMQLDQPNAFANNATGMIPPTVPNSPTDSGSGFDGSAGLSGLGDTVNTMVAPTPQPDFGGDDAGLTQPSGGNANASVKASANAMEQAANELRGNPASYLSRMGVMAVGEGYQVTDAMPSDIKNRLGLESGDRVISVNGQNVGSDPMRDADLLQEVQESGQANIQVQRGEQVITIRQQF